MVAMFLCLYVALVIMTKNEVDSHSIIAFGILFGAYLIASAIRDTEK